MYRTRQNLIQKIFVTVILFSFITPIATLFCCCTAIAQTDSHEHGATKNSGHENNCHEHSNESGTPHGHDKCSHPQIVCNLVNQSSQYLPSLTSSEKFAAKLLQGGFLVANNFPSYQKSPALSGTGPPGSHFSSTPLFLSISVLRI